MHRFFNAKWNFIDIQTLQHITKTFLALIWVEHPYHLVKHEMTRYCITPLIPQSSSLSRFHLVKSLRRIISITSIIYRSCESESWGFMTFHDQKKKQSPCHVHFLVVSMLKKLPCWIPDFFAGRDLAAGELHLLQALYVLVTTVKHFHFYPWRHLKRMSWGKS